MDSETLPIDLDYWSKITNDVDRSDIGLVLAPGIDSQFEFAGSGTYEISN